MSADQVIQIICLSILATVALVVGENGVQAVKITHTDLPCSCPSAHVQIIDYNANLVLRHGFDLIGESRVDIELKFVSGTCIAKWITKTFACSGVKRPQDHDNIVLHMGRNLRVTGASLVVADSIEEIKFGQVETIEVEEVKVGDLYQIISIVFEQNLPPAGSFGRLSITYTSSIEAIRNHWRLLLSKNQLKSLSQMRSRSGEAWQLFPYPDNRGAPEYGASFQMIVQQQQDTSDNNINNYGAIVSNFPFISTRKSVQVNHNIIQASFSYGIAIDELAFALGPFFAPKTHDSTKYPEIFYNTGDLRSLENGIAREFYAKSLKWMQEQFPDTESPMDLSIDLNKHFKSYLSIGEMGGDSAPEEGPKDVEIALTMALWVARKWFGSRLLENEHMKSWLMEGLAAHFAIRCVRELKPELAIDEYVRSTLLPWALGYETNDKYDQLRVDYNGGGNDARRDNKKGSNKRVDATNFLGRIKCALGYETCNDKCDHQLKVDYDGPKYDAKRDRIETRSVETIFLWRIKCAAIVDMIKRTFFRSQPQEFDKAMVSLMQKRTDIVNETPLMARALRAFARAPFIPDDVLALLEPWLELEGYPCVGVSLDRHDRHIRLDQIPISWLDRGEADRVKEDGVWPMPVRISFATNETIGGIIETRQVSIDDGFNGKRDTFRVKLPDWFNLDPDSGHRFWLNNLDDPTEMLYYLVSYSPDLIKLTNKHNTQQQRKQ